MQTLKSDIRNRILSAAKEQFVQRGYLKTSMREIADAVDVGVGNLYNYFENKDELFCVILLLYRMLWSECCRNIMEPKEQISCLYVPKSISSLLSMNIYP